MKFEYFAGEQRSPEWFELRHGKVTASRLSDWLAVAKKDGKTPLKARLDYEKELAFEQTFGVSYENPVTKAMKDGIDYEPFVREQYSKITGNAVKECGAWYNDIFVASPDGTVGEDGLLEIKVVREGSFVDVLDNDVPDKWMLQIQGQIMASGKKWCDFVAANLLTGKMKVVRVEADAEMIMRIAESLDGYEFQATIPTDKLFDFQDPVPAIEGTNTGEVSWET